MKKHPALNAILSSFILFLIPLFFVGIFVEQIQYIQNGVRIGGLSSVELFRSGVEYYQKTFSLTKDFTPKAALMMQYSVFMSIFLVTIIICAINSIILFINSIIGIVKPINSSRITRPLLSLSSSLLIYVAVFLGLMYGHVTDGKNSVVTTIGAGPIILIIVAVLGFAFSAIIHCVVEDKRPGVSKMFHIFIGTLSVVGTLLLLLSPVSVYSYSTKITAEYGLIRTVLGYIGATTEEGAVEWVMALYLSIIGLALYCVAIGFISKTVSIPVSSYNKEVDYEKSCIVRSSLFLGFTILATIFYYSATTAFYTKYAAVALGWPLILCFVITVLNLAFSIAAKAISAAKTPKKAE